MNAWLRTMFIMATIAAACFALLQVGCRVLFWQLPQLERPINELLRGQGIVVTGLEGRWNGLNPGIFASTVRFPAGEAVGFDFELDLLESLGRNRLVARRMTVADGRIAFDKTPAGWQLRGWSPRGAFDLGALLTHSDQVWLRGRIDAFETTRSVEIHIETMLLNEDGNHRFHIGAQTGADCGDCALTIDGDLAEGGVGDVRVRAQPLVLNRDAIDMLGLAPLFAGATGAGRLELRLAGDWQRTPAEPDSAASDEQARLQFELAGHGLPGGSARLDATLTAWREAEHYRGRIDSLALASGDAAFTIADGGFKLQVTEPFAELWLPPFPLEGVAVPVAAAFGAEHVLGRYLGPLAPHARIENLAARFDARGVAFHGRAAGAAVAGHQGVPEVANASFTVAGHQRAVRLDFDSRDVLLAFPDHVPARRRHRLARGSLTFAFGGNHLGLRGTDLTVVDNETRGDGGFALARARAERETHLVIDGRVNHVDIAASRDYMPLSLAPTLRSWLLGRIHAGQLHDMRMIYQGLAKTRGSMPMRRFEMAARFVDGTVDYHADWPRAERLAGRLTVTADETRISGDAYAFDLNLPGFELRVPHAPAQTGAATAELKIVCETDVARLIDFAWATPVHAALPFLSKTWTGTGRVRVAADLRVPLREQPLRPGDLRMDFHFDDAGFDLADIGLHFDAVDKNLHFEFPADLASDTLQGTLFGAPLRIAIASDADAVRFMLAGSATAEHAYRLLDIEDPGIADGRFDFDAAFTVFPGSTRAMELQVESDLAGLAVTLPPPLAKTRDEPRPLTASMQFLDTHVAVAARYGDADGWLHTGDGGIRAGAIGIGAPVPMIDAGRGRLVLGGGLDEIDAATMAELITPAAGIDRPFAWELRRFRVGKVTLDALELTNAMLDGYSDGGEVSFAVTTTELAGTVAKSGDEPWQVKLTELHVPATGTGGDPLNATVIDRLLAADVDLAGVRVGDEDYGAWKLSLRPQPNGVALTDIVADVRGLRIESTGEVFWSRSGETRFAGEVTAQNLFDVLPLWGFAPSVESDAFHAVGEVRWPGSPLNFDLAHLSGDVELNLDSGRFLDVAQGATPILSLINFSTVAKRMNLDFSDVFGTGVSFESVLAQIAIDDGLAKFTKPAEIVGTGSSFLVTGTVDLDSGALDNEMIVTLPLHSSLPWYAAILALSNPAGAAAVVVGRQVFKDQIKRLTSGKYHIGGTFDEPSVAFVDIFDNDVDVEQDAGGDREGATRRPASTKRRGAETLNTAGNTPNTGNPM